MKQACDNILRIQIIATSWDSTHITGHTPQGIPVTVAIPSATCYRHLHALLSEGCRLNLLSSHKSPDGTLHPHDIILNPDYLIDISSLARCVQPYGSPPIGYILNMFEQNSDSAARLLGEAANMFLDDCVNEQPEKPASYRRSMEKFFREYPLQLSVCDEIDHKFFAAAQEQFANISSKAGSNDILPTGRFGGNNILLEPSFFCEALGLQGRIDLLQSDCSRLVELKSGKADEFRGGAKQEHRLQMSLYKEMLCYNMMLPPGCIQPILFYSRYPRFHREESTITEISEALMLRNRIVSLLCTMCHDGLRNTLENTTADDLNERGTSSRLWANWQRPGIERLLAPIKNSDPLLREYVFGNMAFVAREMRIAKTGGTRRHSGRCFADVWNATVEEKAENGDILIDLSIESIKEEEGISDIRFTIPGDTNCFYPNFRVGDTVFIYRRDCDNDTAINRPVTRGTLTEITPRHMTLHLRHKQRNRSLFPKEGHYAVEHDQLDSTFRASFSDLYSLLQAPEERTRLLLARRKPEFNRTRTLIGDYGNNYINDIVLKAKQADDLFLLVGPPGTGKTSQALAGMVREFHSDTDSNILLVSYTNRAVDEICHTLENLPEKPPYIRIGSEQNCRPQYTPRLLKNAIDECHNREHIRHLIKKTRIFVGTTASLTARKELFRIKQFHTAIIDEATQILESQLAGLLAAVTPNGESAIHKFILIGDPKQLPAVVSQTPSESKVKSERLQSIGITDYGASLFERIYRHDSQSPTEGLVAMLYRQGRMHPDVASFANSHFYDGKLCPIPLPHQQEENIFTAYDIHDTVQTLLATRRTAFIATKKEPNNGTQKNNENEAQAIARFVKAYHALYIANNMDWNPGTDIGIIVPFRNQIAPVSHAIAQTGTPQADSIVIDTVERFQGSQREMILFGTTISHPSQIEMLSSPATDADGRTIDRKLNVAITRARRRMYIFGNTDALSASPIYSALMDELGCENNTPENL